MSTELLTPLKISKPPTRVVEYEFSYARQLGQMRWRHQRQEWVCKSIVGDVWCRSANGDTGRLYLVCQLSIDDGGNATVWSPDGVLLAGLKAEHVATSLAARNGWGDFPQGRVAHWRLCLNRAMKTWRIRDENEPNKIWNTNGYRGILHLRWMDSGPHVHADQAAWINKQGVVTFDG